MITEFTEVNTVMVHSNDFAKTHPEFIIKGYDDPTNIEIEVREYAPKIFRTIRKDLLTEDQLHLSLIPKKN